MIPARPGDASWQRIAEAARLVCHTQVGAVTTLDHGVLVLQASTGWENPAVRMDSAIGRLAIDTGTTILVPDVSAHPQLQQDPIVRSEPFWRSYAAAPIAEPGGPVVGEVWVADPRSVQLSGRQLSVLEQLAATAASLLRQRDVRHQLLDTLVGAQQDRALLSLHSSVLSEVARGVPVNETLQRLAARVEWLLGRGHCAVVRPDPGGSAIRHVAAPTLPPGFRDSLLAQPMGTPRPGVSLCTADSAAAGRLVWIGSQELAVGHGLAACWTVPINSDDGGLLGALLVYQTSTQEPSAEQWQLLERLVDLARLTIEQQNVRERLVFLSSHDELTGLLNRSSFFARAAEVLQQVAHGDNGIAVVFVDVDGFKRHNDRHGHTVGDELLRTVGKRLQTAVRDHDLVARFGGDEFVLLCQGLTDDGQVDGINRRLLTGLARPVPVNEDEVRLTVSIGAATAGPGASKDIETLVNIADAAMYQAKRQGGNRIEVTRDESAPLANQARGRSRSR